MQMGTHRNPRRMLTITPELEEAIDSLAKDERRAWSQMAVVLLYEALKQRGVKVDEKK